MAASGQSARGPRQDSIDCLIGYSVLQLTVRGKAWDDRQPPASLRAIGTSQFPLPSVADGHCSLLCPQETRNSLKFPDDRLSRPLSSAISD